MNHAMIIYTWARLKPRLSGAQCGESRTLRSNWEGRRIIPALDLNKCCRMDWLHSHDLRTHLRPFEFFSLIPIFTEAAISEDNFISICRLTRIPLIASEAVGEKLLLSSWTRSGDAQDFSWRNSRLAKCFCNTIAVKNHSNKKDRYLRMSNDWG